MSYSKYHYIEMAVTTIDSKLLLHHIYTSQIFALCYLAYACHRQEADFSLPTAELISNLNKKDSFKTFLEQNICAAKRPVNTILPFKTVPQDELKNYLGNYSKDLGEFIDNKSLVTATTWEIARLAAQILTPEAGDDVADFGFGSGNFSFALLDDYQVRSVTGYEINEDIEAISEITADVLGYDVTVELRDLISNPPADRKFSKIFCDCPFNMELGDKKIKAVNSSFSGLKHKVKTIRSEYLFIQTILNSLDSNGRAVVLIPLGILAAQDGFMQYLVENGYLQAIIQFGPNLLKRSNIKFAMMVLSFGNTAVKLVDASDIYSKSRLKNILTPTDQEEIKSAYFGESSHSRIVSSQEISEKGFNLHLSYYFYETKLTLGNVACDYRPLAQLCTKKISRGMQCKADELDKKSTQEVTNYYYLAANSIQDNEITQDLPNLNQIEERSRIYCLQEGDIVLANICLNPLKVAIIRNLGEKQIVASSTIYTIRLNPNIIIPEYLKILLETAQAAKICSIFNAGSLLAISAAFLNSLLIPVLPLTDQQKIVDKYRQYSSQIDELKKSQQELEDKRNNILAAFADNLL